MKVDTPGTMGAVGWCQEPHDSAVRKRAAGREKDQAFVAVLVRDGHVGVEPGSVPARPGAVAPPGRAGASLGMLDRLA